MIHSHSATGTHATGGCGCGCGGGSKRASCSCQKPDCQDCQTTALVRPRFFAGQLLTEDDLDSLTNYVVAKQRLHTRHLHGAGVVCGLEVVCHPCDDKVIVQPGYALDCCGNDIAVPCPTELDILAMIRRVQLEKGIDCGDPCADRPAGKTRASSASAPATNIPGVPPGTDRVPPEKPTIPATKYCLYVRYCEQPAEPVKPYVLEEPCGDSSCEHTRVREGYRFELRCEEDMTTTPLTMSERMKMCGDPEEMKKEIAGAEFRRERYYNLDLALMSVQSPEPVKFSTADVETFKSDQAVLAEFAKKYTAAEETPIEPAILRKALDSYTGIARTTAKAQFAKLENIEVPPDIARSTEKAASALQDVEPLLRERVDSFENAEDLLIGKAALSEGLKWTDPAMAKQERMSTASKLFMAGALHTPEIANYDLQQLSQLREWLRRRIGAGLLTDCRLRGEVEAIRIDPEIARSEEALAKLRAQLDAALQRYVSACFCMALLPPCAPCDDTAVLLACLTVENCEVVDICNLERTFVLSWPAMRYWVSWIGKIGELLEDLCCPKPPEKEYRQTWGADRYLRVLPTTGISAPMASTWYTAMGSRSNLLTKAGDVSYSLENRAPFENLLRFVAPTPASAGTVSRLTQLLEGSVVSASGEVPRVAETFAVPEGDRLAEALRSVAPRRVIDDLIAQRVDEIRPQRDLTAIAEAVDDRIASVNTAIGDVKKELRRRPTATELMELKPVKKIATGATEAREASKRLEESNRQLVARLDDLQKRVQLLENPR